MDQPDGSNVVEGNIDRVVLERFFSGKKGVFVEVGAARPDYLSISKSFRAQGWRILAIEPNPIFCELQRKAGNEVLQYACGDHDEDNVDFFVVDVHGKTYQGGSVTYESFSSLGIKDDYSQLKSDLDVRKIKVSLRKMDTILQDHAPDVAAIDIIAIDVEGWEMEVLNGLNIPKYRPRVMIIENLFRSTKYVSRLNRAGYYLWRRSFPNDVYVSTGMPYFLRVLKSAHVRFWSSVRDALGRLTRTVAP